MEKFEVNVLGSGSALPTILRNPSCHIVNVREKLFMIDCGEGTQLQLRRQKIKFTRLNHILISHLHGDHCFGLIGMLSTFGMLGRTADMFIHAPKELETLLRPQLDFFCKELPYSVVFHTINPQKNEVIYQDRSVTISTIPLKHRMPCCGFLFQEVAPQRHLIKEMIDFYKIPIRCLKDIREGIDYVTEEGEVVSNERLTRSGGVARSYAYCSDTSYSESIIPIIKGVDLLYHEATFLESEQRRAKETAHSTAKQAAQIALQAEVKQLMIGHFSARYEKTDSLLHEAKAVFKNTIEAKEGKVFCIE